MLFSIIIAAILVFGNLVGAVSLVSGLVMVSGKLNNSRLDRCFGAFFMLMGLVIHISFLCVLFGS